MILFTLAYKGVGGSIKIMNNKLFSMIFAYLKKAAPVMVVLALAIAALNFGAYDPYNEIASLAPEQAEANALLDGLLGSALTTTSLSTSGSLSTATIGTPTTPAVTTTSVTTPTVTEVATPTTPTVTAPTVSSYSGSLATCNVRVADGGSSTIVTGSSVTLSWETSGFSNITINGVSMTSLTGDYTFTNIQANTTYTLIAKSADGNSECRSTVSIICVPPVAAPSCIDRGYDFTVAKFSWNGTSYVQTASRAGYTVGVTGTAALANWTSNPAVVAVIAATSQNYRTYTGGTSGTVDKCDIGSGCYNITTIEMCGNDTNTPPAPTCDLNPTAITVVSGNPVTLDWTTTNAASATLTDFGTVALGGIVTTAPLTASKVYTLTVLGTNGQSIQCQSNVTVTTTPPPLPSCVLTAAPDSVVSGGTATLTWSTVNAVSASIDQAIGAVATGTNQTRTVSPVATTTYTMTVVNSAGQSATCADTVVVTTPPDPELPRCVDFTASPATILRGGTSTLSWNTVNGTSVAINNGVGVVAATGTVPVSPLATTEYILTVFGDNNTSHTCAATVTVTTPSDPELPRCDYLNVSTNSLPIGGGSVNLSWATTNADSVTLTPGFTTVGLNGSSTVSITATTNFVLTAIKGTNQDTCTQTVTVATTPTPLSCAANVSFTASPTSITRGNSSTLTWSTTGITSLSFDNGITATGLSGSVSVEPANTTTYTMTATNGTSTIACPVTVSVSTGGGGGGSSSPRCELSVSDNKISLGDSVKLTWDSSRATSLFLEDETADDILVTTDGLTSSAKERLFDGTLTVSPKKDTTYVLTVKRGSKTRTCEVKVDISDNVVVKEIRDQKPLVSGIALTSVPYTGFEAGPILTLMFYMLLMAWALYVAYLLVIRRDVVGGVQLAVNKFTPAPAPKLSPEAIRPDVFVAQVTAPAMPAVSTITPTNLPTGTPAVGYANHTEDELVAVVSSNVHNIDDAAMTAIENHAHAKRVLLSSDAIRHFVATTTSEAERIIALDEVIAAAKAQFPAEDGWIVINEKRMQELCTVCAVNQVRSSAAPYVPAIVPEGAGSLAEAIVTGNVVAAYELIGHRPMFALADAAADLDAVYRLRRGEVGVASELLMKETAKFEEGQILTMIQALTGALDGTYTDEASAVKMAIMKAIKAAA